MKYNLKFGFIGLLLLLTGLAYGKEAKPFDVAKALGWVNHPNTCNLCGGYYRAFPIFYKPNPLLKKQDDNYDIDADEAVYATKGPSTLKGKVEVTRPFQRLSSNIAYLYRNQKTKKLDHVVLKGKVKMQEPDKLALAKSAKVNFNQKTVTLRDVYYRMALKQTKQVLVKNKKTGRLERRMYQMTAHGRAKTVHQDRQKKMTVLKDATYTTCTPNCHAWYIEGTTVKLNSKSGFGQAYNTLLFVKHIPIFYWPYYSFPIDNRRKTGFLNPSFGHSSRDGMRLSLPYYLNLAPNYDATITPKLMTSRGLYTEGLFRYLTPKSDGKFHLGFIFDDAAFRKFKKDAPEKYPNNQQLISELNNDSSNRYSFSWEDHTQIASNMLSDINYNYMSDDYMIRDFGDNLVNTSNNQVIRQGKINYISDHWNFLGNFQYYQTLHRIDQATVDNQYSRMPQLIFNADYPDSFLGLNYQLQSEFDLFTKNRLPGDNTHPVTGKRIVLTPSLSKTFSWPFVYITPKIQAQLDQYSAHNLQSQYKKDPGVAIPMFDVKTGLYFDRFFKLFNRQFDQTLEPELYYLYVPYRKQNDFPLFDSGLQSFDYNYLFSNNRFSGQDRVGDANRVTWGLTSRLIDRNSGEEKAKFSVGQILYFQHRKVELTPDSISTFQDRRTTSPIAGMATYDLNPNWSLNASATWDSHLSQFTNQEIGVNYKLDPYHILTVTYHYQKNADIETGSADDDLKQTDVTGFWRVTPHWSVMGRWNYNWSHGHNQIYFYGLAYDSCCWALRFVKGRTFTGQDANNPNKYLYDNVFYIEFALKGLTNIGDSNTSSFLSDSVNNYIDTFGQEN